MPGVWADANTGTTRQHTHRLGPPRPRRSDPQARLLQRTETAEQRIVVMMGMAQAPQGGRRWGSHRLARQAVGPRVGLRLAGQRRGQVDSLSAELRIENVWVEVRAIGPHDRAQLSVDLDLGELLLVA